MSKKYIITALSLSALLATSTNFVFAQTATSPATIRGRHEFRINPTGGAINGNASLTTIQQRADQLITQRLASLNNMLTKISGMKKLTDAQKTQLTANINADITGLTNLKAKIDADTDAATALADTKTIYTAYRVYAEFEPQTAVLATSDSLSKAIDQLTLLATKLQTRISSASAAGDNVTALTPLLTDMQNKIADAKTQQTNAENNVFSLTPSSYNANPKGTHTTLTTSHGLISTARNDLRIAMQDAIKIVQGLKAFKTTTTVTPSVTITPTPTI